jgi:hypothetical protein
MTSYAPGGIILLSQPEAIRTAAMRVVSESRVGYAP